MGLGELDIIFAKGSRGYLLTFDVNENVFLTVTTMRNVRLPLVYIDLKRMVDKIKSGESDWWGDENLPYPYIFKPPTPPGDLGIVGQAQLRELPKKEVFWDKPYCKNYGNLVPEGESICPACGKKLI